VASSSARSELTGFLTSGTREGICVQNNHTANMLGKKEKKEEREKKRTANPFRM
jgi:hypothetical protein